LPETPSRFATDYVDMWVQRFDQLVDDNATNPEGLVHNAAQNARLGRVIEGLEAAAG
jgi:hypothetical protein